MHEGWPLLKYHLAYDADCGPCRRFKEMVDFMDPRERIDFLSLEEADDLGLLDKVPRRKRHTSFHLISPDGEVESGAEAIPSVIDFFPLGELFSKGLSAPGWRTLVAGVCSALSRLHDSGSYRYQSALARGSAGRSENVPKTLPHPSYPMDFEFTIIPQMSGSARAPTSPRKK